MILFGLRQIISRCATHTWKVYAHDSSRTLYQRASVTRLLSTVTTEEKESVQEEEQVQTLQRIKQVPVETSIQYLNSEAYKLSYGSDPIWTLYRRNFKGPRQPRFTRKTCIRKGEISTGNPCPICRDEYLVLHHENVELLKQFISPHTGEVLSFLKTGLCQKRHKELLVAIEKARDYGYLTYDVPFRKYDYSLYYKN